MSEVLNKFFVSVFNREESFDRLEVVDEEEEDLVLMGEVIVTEEMVMKHINKLKMNKAPGVDGIGSTFLKKIGASLCMPLVSLVISEDY